MIYRPVPTARALQRCKVFRSPQPARIGTANVRQAYSLTAVRIRARVTDSVWYSNQDGQMTVDDTRVVAIGLHPVGFLVGRSLSG
jgi:hypothetical protein